MNEERGEDNPQITQITQIARSGDKGRRTGQDETTIPEGLSTDYADYTDGSDQGRETMNQGPRTRRRLSTDYTDCTDSGPR